MGKYDDVLYDYFTDDERFADFYNGVVFSGQTVVRAEMLEDASERYVAEDVAEAAGKIPRRKSKFRDVKKRAKNGVDFAIMAIENQACIDYTMPWRIMQYDQLEYGRQLRKIREKKVRECLKRGKKVNRFSVKFSAEDKLRPVYTTCFYHGTEKWNGPKSLADMMDFEGCNQAMKELFHDYKMTLVCVDDLEDLSVFRTDLKLLLQALKLRKNRQEMRELFRQEEFMNVPLETARVIAVMTDTTEILENLEDYENEGGVNMCQAMDELRAEWKMEGIEEGIKEGICAVIAICQELNASYEYVVEKLKEKYNLSEEESRNYMDLYWIS